MITETAQTKHGKQLPVLVREVLCGEGVSARELRVFCVRRNKCMAVQECTTCELCDGFSLDPKGRRSMLICSYEPGEEAAPMNATPRASSLADHTPISEIMTDEVLCVTQDVDVDELTQLFLTRAISGVPVVDDQGKPVGVVSKTDLVRESHEHEDGDEEQIPLRLHSQQGDVYELGPGFHAQRVSGVSVKDIMTPVAYTLQSSTSVSQAAALMAFEGIHRLPIVCKPGGEVVGVLSALDILRWIGERDGYLRQRHTDSEDTAKG